MDGTTVRECVPGDESDYCRLNIRFIEEVKEQYQYWDSMNFPDESGMRSIYREILGMPAIMRVFVAKYGAAIVGFANVQLVYSVWSEGMAWNVDDLYVEPGYRGRGVAETIMRTIERCARKEDCRRIQLHTELDNERANNLYGKLGFRRERMLFHMKTIR
ncbi:MAG: GNAT family N-acetyltransferase [Spirochaetes bacterium]|nr:GNAT family N-acetyltransferase [Spirochaetota bacterium]